MKFCVIDDELCINVAHIVSVYIFDEFINVRTALTDEYTLVTLDPFDPADEDDMTLLTRIYDEILEELANPKILFVNPAEIAAKVLDE